MGEPHTTPYLTGRTLCKRCNAANLNGNKTCFNCHQPLNQTTHLKPISKRQQLITEAERALAQTPRSHPEYKALQAKLDKARKTKLTHREAYDQLTTDIYEVAVIGNPITKGSGVAVAKGVYKAQNSKELYAWEQKIEDAFREKYWTPDWKPLEVPVHIDYIFTVPLSQAETKRMHKAGHPFYPVGVPDWDKLARAVSDSFTHRDGKRINHGINAGKEHFKLVADDSYIVGTPGVHKTYPAPYHVHPAALPQPGVQIRVRALKPLTTWLGAPPQS